MPKGNSLVFGRNNAPLSDRQQAAVVNTFYGFERSAVVRYDAAGRTVFRTFEEGDELKYEIVFGPDIYPGIGVGDPNSILSMKSAVVHEISHQIRHIDGTEIDELELWHLDEALTSLGAALRFRAGLTEFEIMQLISDAYQRIELHVSEFRQNAAEVAQADDG